VKLFREERRGVESLDEYRDCVDIIEDELDELRREHLGDDNQSYEKAMKEFET